MSEGRGGVEKGANCFACKEKRVSLAGSQPVKASLRRRNERKEGWMEGGRRRMRWRG